MLRLNQLASHGDALDADDIAYLDVAAAQRTEDLLRLCPAHAPTRLHSLNALAARLGVVDTEVHAKTALGLRDWAPESCLAQLRLPQAQVDLHLPEMSPDAAAQAGARSMGIGVAPVGGQIPPAWEPMLLRAVRAGLDVVSGITSRCSKCRVSQQRYASTMSR